MNALEDARIRCYGCGELGRTRTSIRQYFLQVWWIGSLQTVYVEKTLGGIQAASGRRCSLMREEGRMPFEWQ